MTSTLSLSIIEIVLLLFGAIILGITIHFFIASRRNLNAATRELDSKQQGRDEWKLRYFNDIEQRDKELNELRARFRERESQARESEENAEIYMNEAEEVRKTNKELKFELQQLQTTQARLQEEMQQLSLQAAAPENAPDATQPGAQDRLQGDAVLNDPADLRLIEKLKQENQRLRDDLDLMRQEMANEAIHAAPAAPQPDYLEQLRLAQSSLLEHNQKISQLIGNIDVIKEKEEKEREILHDKEILAAELDQVRGELDDKERQISSIREKEKLTTEMTSRLDSAYNDFQMLQEKIGKLENQLHHSRMGNMELEDLREQHHTVNRELEAQRSKAHQLAVQNQALTEQLAEAEDNLREVSFQRQQLQKKAAYLEELNMDLQVVSDANKKLENQLRRIGELESMLNVVSEERDQLAGRTEQR